MGRNLKPSVALFAASLAAIMALAATQGGAPAALFQPHLLIMALVALGLIGLAFGDGIGGRAAGPARGRTAPRPAASPATIGAIA